MGREEKGKGERREEGREGKRSRNIRSEKGVGAWRVGWGAEREERNWSDRIYT